MAAINITTSRNLSTVTYAAGDDLTVVYPAVLTIDSANTVFPRSIKSSTGGTIEVVNSSPAAIFAVTFSTASSASAGIVVSNDSLLKARGQMLTVHTGTGAANQSIDFNVGELAKVPFPSHVEIETVAGSGEYGIPWCVAATAGKPRVFAPTDFSNGECGNVLFWNATTRTLSCGDGTRGNLIPLGCKVRIPNIYVHAAGAIAENWAARAQLVSNTGGKLDLECVAFSDAFRFYTTTGGGESKLKHAGFVGSTYLLTAAQLIAESVFSQPDCNWLTTQITTALSLISRDVLSVKNCGAVNSRNNITTGATAAASLGISLDGRYLKQCENILGGIIGDRDADHYALQVGNAKDATIKNITALNGRPYIVTNISNISVYNVKHAAMLNGAPTNRASSGLFIDNADGVSIYGFERVGSPVRSGYAVQIGANAKNCNVYDVDYPLSDSIAGILFYLDGVGGDIDVTQSGIVSTGSLTAGATGDSYNIKIKGVYALGAKVTPRKNTVYNGVIGNPANIVTSVQGLTDYCAAYLFESSLTPVNGWICFGAFGAGTKVIASGDALISAGEIKLPTTGSKVIAESPIFNGITSFTASELKYMYTQAGVLSTDVATAPSGVNITFAVARDTGAFTIDQPLTAGNLQMALSSLYEYDSNKGCRIRLTIEATTDDAARKINKVFWNVAHNAAYATPNVTVLVRGVDATDTVTMHLLNDDSVLATLTGGGTHSLSVPNTVLNQQVYFNRSINGVLVYSTKYAPVTLKRGDNGNIDLFAGASVQLAQSAEMAQTLERDYARIDAIFNRTGVLQNVYDSSLAVKTAVDSQSTEVSAIKKKVGFLVANS